MCWIKNKPGEPSMYDYCASQVAEKYEMFKYELDEEKCKNLSERERDAKDLFIKEHNRILKENLWDKVGKGKQEFQNYCNMLLKRKRPDETNSRSILQNLQ